jgi:hypothetical protein
VLTTARQRRHGLATFETWVVWGIFAVSVCIWRAKPTLSSIQRRISLGFVAGAAKDLLMMDCTERDGASHR